MKDPIKRGLPLEEAFLRLLPEEVRAELNRCKEYRDWWCAPQYGSGPSRDSDLYLRYHNLREPFQADFIQMLHSGELIATGIALPLHVTAPRIIIPNELWKVLKLNFEESTAEGEGIKLINVEVLERNPTEASPPVDSIAPPAKIPEQRAPEQPILQFDGTMLELGTGTLIFRGQIQQEIIRQLVDAFHRRKKLRSAVVLQRAGSNAASLAKAFNGSPNWSTLKRILRQENGHCWLELD